MKNNEQQAPAEDEKRFEGGDNLQHGTGLGRHNADIDMDEGKLHHGIIGGNMKLDNDELEGQPSASKEQSEKQSDKDK